MSASSPDKKYLSLDRAGKLVGAECASLKMWCEHGEVDGAKKFGADWFVPEESLLLLGELASERRHAPIPLPVKHALTSILLIVTIAAGFQFFSLPEVRQDLVRGLQVSEQRALAPAVERMSTGKMVATPAALGTIGNGLELGWRRLADFFAIVADNIAYYARQVAEAWSRWWQDDDLAAQEAIKESLRAELKADFDAQIQALVDQINASSNRNSGVGGASFNPDTGVVLVPSTGEGVSDEAVKTQLKNMFSDEVKIEFDESGNAGIITPIYPSGVSSDRYIFILTPIKQ